MIEKVAIICPNIGIVYSGMGPDFRVLVAKARKSAQAYWKIYGEYPPTKILTQEIATIMQQATHSGYVPPRRGSGATCTDATPPSQRCPTVWRLPPHRRLGPHARAHAIPGRPLRVLLGLEGKRNWQEHGEREDFPGKAVRESASRGGGRSCPVLTAVCGARYNDDISLEDAIHTALLTLKEGFEGSMTEKTIEIGVVTVPSQADLESGKVEGTGRTKPTFRKLTEEEIRDYLAM